MALGALELIAVVVAAGLAGLSHLIVALVMRASGKRCPRRVLLAYGFPVCFAVGGLLTPPDPLSLLFVAVPCLILYAVVATLWIVVGVRQLKPMREQPAAGDAS